MILHPLCRRPKLLPSGNLCCFGKVLLTSLLLPIASFLTDRTVLDGECFRKLNDWESTCPGANLTGSVRGFYQSLSDVSVAVPEVQKEPFQLCSEGRLLEPAVVCDWWCPHWSLAKA